MNDEATAAQEAEENGLTLDEDESRGLQEVFSTIFPQYLVPLEELIDRLLAGQSSPEVIEGLRGALTPLCAAAGSIGVVTLQQLLDELRSTVDALAVSELDQEARDHVVEVFYRLKEAVHEQSGSSPNRPQAAQGFVGRLSALEGVGPAEVQRVLAAGISSREQVAAAAVDEIAAVTGLSEELATRIHQAFGGAPRPPPGSRGPAGVTKAGSASGPGSPAAPGAAEPHQAAAADELADRIALVAVVRERIVLEALLRREDDAADRSAAEAGELRRQRVLLEVRLEQRRLELARERELNRRREEEIARLQAEIEDTKHRLSRAHAGESSELADLGERLRELKQRILTRAR